MKQELIKLHHLLKAVIKVLNDPMLITVSVIIQNMIADSDKDIKEFNKYINVLLAMRELCPDSHVIHWTIDNVGMILNAHQQTQNL